MILDNLKIDGVDNYLIREVIMNRLIQVRGGVFES